ncbi:MAG: T9SS type A sorting domain-containing protein [Salibacteraceae bacterium]
MKTSIVFLAFCCFFPLFLQAQVQPQFKFYLAFEDAKHEKDTVWIVMDSTASTGLDSHLNEKLIPLDSGQFHVFFGTPVSGDDTVAKKLYAKKPSGQLTLYVKAKNHQLPITIRWDTNLLKNHTLPFELKQAWMTNDYLWQCSACSEGPLHFYDTVGIWATKRDSIILNYNGGPSHFPLQVFFSKNPWIDYLNVENMSDSENTLSDAFSVYPKPASTILNVDRNDHEQCSYFIIDLLGKTHQAGRLQSFPAQINLSHFQTGNYILVLKDTKTISYESILILK